MLANPNFIAEPCIFLIRVRFPALFHTKFPKHDCVMLRKFGRGRRNRTLIRGFGDRYSTVELCPCFVSATNSHRPQNHPHFICPPYRFTPVVCATIAQTFQKSSGKYYKTLIAPAQAIFHIRRRIRCPKSHFCHTFRLRRRLFFGYNLFNRRENTSWPIG